MILLEEMVRAGRLHEFVNEIVHIRNEELEEETLWDIWLHRIFDKSFAEFKDALNRKETAAPTPEEIKSIAIDSQKILAGFAADEGMVGRYGTVQAAGDYRGT